MPGWDSCASARISLRMLSTTPARGTLTRLSATCTPVSACTALQTTPIPPWPSRSCSR
jgi:hypothetical protein